MHSLANDAEQRLLLVCPKNCVYFLRLLFSFCCHEHHGGHCHAVHTYQLHGHEQEGQKVLVSRHLWNQQHFLHVVLEQRTTLLHKVLSHVVGEKLG